MTWQPAGPFPGPRFPAGSFPGPRFPAGSFPGPRFPQRPGWPGHLERPGWPGHLERPGWPWPPEYPAPVPQPSRPSPAVTVARVWLDQGDWPGRLYERLLDERIIMAHGWLDGEAATRLAAQLLTLDAESTRPIRLELQNLEAELAAALSVMGVLDTLRAPVCAYAGGRVSGPAVGVLAAAPNRYGYPSALVVLCEPRLGFEGTVASVTAQQEQAQIMLTGLYTRLAEVTGHELGQVRADAARQTVLTVSQAVEYGLLTGRAPGGSLAAPAAGPAGKGHRGSGHHGGGPRGH
jgi:ATP-dependent Clp protease protease subunit